MEQKELLTDLYQLTMAQGYWVNGKANQKAAFNLFFRKNPYEGGFAVSAGLHEVIKFLKDGFSFSEESIRYLSTLEGNDKKPLFKEDFLTYLKNLEFNCDIQALEEGTIVFGGEPILRIQGDILQCQLLETVLLNMINFNTLIATKACRIVNASCGDPVLEFGLRRAQSPQGACYAARAAFIGGCDATSNVLAGYQYGIPVKGTHAHSWVMSFDSEQESFDRYADAMPNNCVFLVDTYDSVEGVKKAIETAKRLESKGHSILGIRLDSGDLLKISNTCRRLLNAAGMEHARIVASNDLDEHSIEDLKSKGACIDIWGVGTNLVTGGDQSALGGVYKLAALQNENGEWESKIKLSEQVIKTSNPGILNLKRLYEKGRMIADVLYSEGDSLEHVVNFKDPEERFYIKPSKFESKELLVDVFKDGNLVYEERTLQEIKDYVTCQVRDELPVYSKLLNSYFDYGIYISEEVSEEKRRLSLKYRTKEL